MTGSITLSASQATLFPNENGFTAVITDSQTDADTFAISGSYTIQSKAFGFIIDQLALNVKNVVTLSTSNVELNFPGVEDIIGGISRTRIISVESAKVTFTDSTVESTMNGFKIYEDGFLFSNFETTVGSESEPVNLLEVVQLAGLTLTVTDFSWFKSPEIAYSGSVTLSATKAKLFPGNASFKGDLSGLVGTYSFSSTASASLSLSVSEMALSFGSYLTTNATNIVITPFANDKILSIDSLDVTFKLKGNEIAAVATGIEVDASGRFDLSTVTVYGEGIAATFNLGEFLPFDITSITLSFIDENKNGTKDAGERFDFEAFDMTVGGYFDFDNMGGLPFTPVVIIGKD